MKICTDDGAQASWQGPFCPEKTHPWNFETCFYDFGTYLCDLGCTIVRYCALFGALFGALLCAIVRYLVHYLVHYCALLCTIVVISVHYCALVDKTVRCCMTN